MNDQFCDGRTLPDGLHLRSRRIRSTRSVWILVRPTDSCAGLDIDVLLVSLGVRIEAFGDLFTQSRSNRTTSRLPEV